MYLVEQNMLTCFNVKKTQYFSNTVHYCRSSMSRLSQTLSFLQSPSFRQASLLWLANWHSALWLAEHHKPRRKFNTPFHNHELQLSKLKTVNNVLSFTISSSREWKRVAWQTVMKLVCVCKQAAITDGLYTPLWCDPVSLSLFLSFCLSHTHTRRTKLCIWAVNSKYLN